MKKLNTTTILFLICAGVFSQQLYNQQPFRENVRTRPDSGKNSFTGKVRGTKSSNPANFQAYIEEWLERAHCPGMSVCVLRNGDVFWKSHTGFANIEENEPVTDSSYFLIASVSKPVVQTVAMHLCEQGFFDLYDDINDTLPFTVIHPNPNYSDSIITYYQLMTHTSSIRHNYNLVADYTVWGYDNPIPLSEWLEGYLIPGGTYYQGGNWWGFPPNDQYKYSNMGCSLLAYIMEYISGQDFDEYCIEHVFNPLGIGNAAFLQSHMDTSYLVTPYEYANGEFIPWLQPGDPNYPSGSLKISALDLSKFLGMYMKEGTYNDSTILNPETIELITNPTSLVDPWGDKMCLNWFYSEVQNLTFHTGGWTIPPIAGTLMGYNKDEHWGVVCFQNTYVEDEPWFEMANNLAYFAKNYYPFSVSSVSVNDSDGDHFIEANEEFSLNLNIRNNINISDSAENIVATVSVNCPYINLISDSIVTIGTLNYLDEFQVPADQLNFSANENLEPGDIEFQLHFTWDEEYEFTTTFNMFSGHADVLLVRDETSLFVSDELLGPQELYLESLDSLGFVTHFYDLEMMVDLTEDFINTFPALIWFTGYDSLNTLSPTNTDLLAGYLDNGGQLFLSGQNISDELTGTNFLENYLHVEHVEDTWPGLQVLQGVNNDPIGDGLTVHISTGGTGLANQYSMSIIEPLGNASKVFNFINSSDGAAIRYENDTYKSVFFACGFEAINSLSNRFEIMNRIMSNYFIMPHPCLPEGITFSTQEEINNFQANYPGCVEIEGDVTISGSAIMNLDGLSDLTSIWGDLTIENNEILDSLTGLDNLTSIGGYLIIDNNDSLESLNGLGNILPASIADLTITNNNSLYECDIWNICQYLINPGGIVVIENNAQECNSIEEVQEHCLTEIDETVNTNVKFSIIPNPLGTSSIIIYTLENNSHVFLRILDLSGHLVVSLVNEYQQQGEQQVIFNTESLKPGVYFCVLKTNEGMQTRKIIKL